MNKKSATQLPDVVVTALKLRLMERSQHLEHQRQILGELELEIAQLTKFLAPVHTTPEQSIQPEEPSTLKPKRLYSPEAMAARRKYQRDQRERLAKANGRLTVRQYTRHKILPETMVGKRNPHTGKLTAIQGLAEAEAKARGTASSVDPLDDHIEVEPTAEQAVFVNEANLTAASHSLPTLKQKLAHLKEELKAAREHCNATEASMLVEQIDELGNEIEMLEHVDKAVDKGPK